MKGVVHEFGKAFTCTSTCRETLNASVLLRSAFGLACSVLAHSFVFFVFNMYLAMSAPSSGIT